MSTKRVLTQLEKTTICTLRIQGIRNKAIADRLGLHEVTVCKVFRSFLRESAPVTTDLANWRTDLRDLAIRALRRALTDSSDPAKAGTLAATVLRGLNEFESESQIHVATLLATVPESQKDRYIFSDSETAGDDKK